VILYWCQGERSPQGSVLGIKVARTILEKKCKKPLDKPHKMCYNECVKRRERKLHEQKPMTSMEEQKLAVWFIEKGCKLFQKSS
jgi:hypothetical protein